MDHPQPPTLEQQTLAAFEAISPDTPVTRENVAHLRAFLTGQGFFGRQQPDEGSEYFPMYVQVAAMADKRPARAGAPSGASAPATNRAGLSAPSRLVSQPTVVLNTMTGASLFRGRESDRSKGIQPAPSFIMAAGHLRQTMALSTNGNPYADLQLIYADVFMERLMTELMALNEDLDTKRKARIEQVGRDIPWLTVIKPATTEQPLILGSSYANKLLDLLYLADRAVLRLLTCSQNNMFKKDVLVAAIHRITNQWRHIVNFIVNGFRMFLRREEVSALRREGRACGWPAGYEKWCEGHFKGKEFPAQVWSEERKPSHRA